jgi:hypothetical protein
MSFGNRARFLELVLDGLTMNRRRTAMMQTVMSSGRTIAASRNGACGANCVPRLLPHPGQIMIISQLERLPVFLLPLVQIGLCITLRASNTMGCMWYGPSERGKLITKMKPTQKQTRRRRLWASILLLPTHRRQTKLNTITTTNCANAPILASSEATTGSGNKTGDDEYHTAARQNDHDFWA